MSGSVEIPDEVVSRAADAFRDNLEYDAFGEVGDDQRFDAMRFALEAARPYLMPTREEIVVAIGDALWFEEHPERTGAEINNIAADVVMALLSTSGVSGE